MHDPRSQFGPAAESYLTSAMHSSQKALDRLIELAQPSGEFAIDVATGAGHVAFALAPFFKCVIVSDITPEMLGVARRTAESRGLKNLTYTFAAAQALPFKSSSLSLVACRLGAHHFSDARAFLSETSRVLKPGGKLLLTDNVGIEGDDAADAKLQRIETLRDPSHGRYLRASEWLGMLAEQGFQVTAQETTRKPINALDWLTRMRVPEAEHATILGLIVASSGSLGDYLRPRGEGAEMTFDLLEMTVVGVKC